MADRSANLPGPEAEDPLGYKTAPSPSDRLDSWKEIAAYLRRGVRTVQRWERQEGLPVRRVQHDERANVFAYKSELDAWLRGTHPRLEAEDDEEEEQSPETTASASALEHGNGPSCAGNDGPEAQVQPGRHRRMWYAGAAVVALVLAVVAVYLLRSRPASALHFQSHDMVLIASFENRTGDPLFDGTMEAALARELANSQFVTVAPRVRINDTLALMRKPLNSRIDAGLGREICLRDGGIQALITGSIDKFGSTYALSAELVDPSSGRTVVSFEEQAKTQGDVLAAVHQLSNHLRQALGEDLSQIRQSDLALQKVTTPSLKALQLYSKADLQMETDPFGEGQKVAFELLKQAITEDPSFASAYILAAWALHNQGRPRSEYLAYAKRALEQSSQSSEPERYFIEGSYYDMTGQADRAQAAYEALLQIDPTHYWATNNLAVLYSEDPTKTQESNALAVRRANLRPNSFGANFTAGYREAIFGGSPALAKTYLGRAKALFPSADAARLSLGRQALWLQLYPAFRAWMKDNVTLAAEELSHAEKNPIMRDGDSEQEAFGFFALALGQVRRANTFFHNVSAPGSTGNRDEDLAILAYFRGDKGSLRYWLRQIARLPSPGFLPISLMQREGLFREANTAVQKFPHNFLYGPMPPGQVERVRGEMFLAHGHVTKAIPLLREGTKRVGALAMPVYFFDAESLAQVYEKRGNLSAALQMLEKASASRARANWAVVMAGAPFWMQDQLDLARLDRRLGRVQDAEKIETQLRKLLADADPDFPMLVELKKLQNTSPARRKSN